MPMNPGIAEHRGFERPVTDSDDIVVVSSQYPRAALIARFLIAAIFVVSGTAKLTDTAATAAHMTGAGIPYADTLAMIAGAAEILGAISIAAGFLTRIGAIGLVLYLIPTTLIFHAFWNSEGKERLEQTVNFLKNLAIMGGLTSLFAFGAGRFSIDYLLRRPRRSRDW
jgi:putative oxidoreductase